MITEAYSQFSAEEIERCAASRARMMAGEDDPNDLDDILAQEDRRVLFGYEPGLVEARIDDADIMEMLDTRLKDVGAAQPFDPISLWEMWPAEGEIWVALG